MSLERYTITLIDTTDRDRRQSKEVWYGDDFQAVQEALRVFCGANKTLLPGTRPWGRWSLMIHVPKRLPRIVAAGEPGDTLDRFEHLLTHSAG